MLFCALELEHDGLERLVVAMQKLKTASTPGCDYLNLSPSVSYLQINEIFYT